MMKKAFLMIVALVLIGFPASAKEIGGVNVPETMTIGNDSLILNGAGLRKKLFIKVYAGALYLKEKSADVRAIISADEPMAVRMHFIYDGVSPKKLIDAWNEGFNNSTGGNTGPIQDRINTFNNIFQVEAKENDIYDIVYETGVGVRVFFKGELKGAIPGLDFKQALFGIWLGEPPADKGLKKGMLGK